jgi:cyclopropane fatty-acyl-phospholipid synthase-like methyltransferase
MNTKGELMRWFPRRCAADPILVAVCILLAVTPGASSAIWHFELPESADPIALQRQIDEAHASGDHAKALELAEQLQEQAEIAHIVALYNVAALQARAGNVEEAYLWLERSFEAGFWDFGHLRRDEDFAALRKEQRFETLWRGAWSKQYIAMLEREERDDFQKPDEVMRTLDFREGERVADVGAGSGYFTVRVARAVGATGSVLATDIRQEMLDFLQNRLREEEIQNVELKLVPEDDPQLPAGGIDTILLVDVWHYIRDPQFAQRLREGLAPGGRVVIIDYRPRPFEERPWGPPPVQQTPREEVDAHFATAGLFPSEVYEFMPEQYFVVYRAR